MPEVARLKPLYEYDAQQLTAEIKNKLGKHHSDRLVARFLCGLTTPIFTRLKARQLTGFAALEKYRFAEVLKWVQDSKGLVEYS